MAKDNDMDRREFRHRRRIRNQILAYLGLIVFAALVVVGVLFAADKLRNRIEAVTAEAQPTPEPTPEAAPDDTEVGSVIYTPDPVDEPEPTPEETPQEPEEDQELLSLLEGMSVEEKIDGLFLVSPEAITGVNTATVAGDGTREAISQYAVGGVVYSAKNVTDGDQFKELVSTTKSMYKEIYDRDLLVMVDEESGFYTLAGKAAGAEKQQSARELAETGNRDNVAQSYETIAAYLRDYDIDADLAPLAAVRTADNPYLGDRVFSDDADIAASMTAAAVEGLSNGGVLSCLAAFPGEGGAASDPDKAAISTEKSAEELGECEYKPFILGIEAGADMIMVSNIVAANAGSGDGSCTLSEEIVTNVLRNTLGFEGVVITAPLDQKACTDSATPGAAALKAFIAGADMIYVRSPLAFKEAREALIGAVNDGTISEELVDTALKRIYSME